MAGVMAEKLHGTDSALDATLDGHTAGGAGAVAGPGVVVSVEPGVFQTDRTLAGSQISLNTARRFSGSFPIEEWDRYEVLGLIGRGGMGTNGGCKCLRGIADPNERVKIREALRIYRKHFVRGT